MYQQQLTRVALRATTKNDETLVRQVYRALDGVEPLRVLGSPVHVQVSDGVVTLCGVVATYPIKAQALEAVRRVRGVQQVGDELLTDDDLEIQVAHALSADLRTHQAAFGIIVNAINGFVSLVGQAPSSEIAQTAKAVAAGVPGVRGVSNRLQVVT
jgi:osmotically-inducible protein OsmY